MRPTLSCQFGSRLKTVCVHTHTHTKFKTHRLTPTTTATSISSRAYYVTSSNYSEKSSRSVHTQVAADEAAIEEGRTTTATTAGTGFQKRPSSSPSLKDKLILASIKSITNVYDLVTLPVYTIAQQPWKVLAQRASPKSALLNKSKNIYGTIVPRSVTSTELEQAGVDDLDSLFYHAFRKFGPKPCTGVREILSRHELHVNGSSSLLMQYEFGDYKWKTYAQIEELATHLSIGLEALGLQQKDKIAIFAETREEWLLTLIAAFKRNLTVVTIFSALDNAGVLHALNETEASVVVTSNELLDRCKEVVGAGTAPFVKQIVYMGRVKGEINGNGNGSPLSNTKMNGDTKGNGNGTTGVNGVRIKSLDRVIGIGSKCLSTKCHHYKPGRDDTAIIMYTSGSTGVPKGVVMSHWNLVTNLMSAMDSLSFSLGDYGPTDKYPGYLPMAHVMELIGELFAFAQGVQIGFSSPTTLIDTSPGIQPGTRGDLPTLRPTVMPSAPLVLERIMRGVTTKVAEKGPLAKSVFDYFYNYKVGWVKKGYRTPILDRLFYGRFNAAVGGKVRLVTTGGAPVAEKTHEFIETVLCAPVCISYGMTETSGLGLFSLAYDVTPGRVGGPIGGSTVIRLVNWEEGGYRVTDKPYPRGEIYIGGEHIAHGGYYKRPELEDFFEDEDGTRWVRSGDIAELHPDGGFNVIDRRKDLVKLSTGEYIGLAKVESVFKMHPVVENICMVVDPFEAYAVAIVVPTQDYLLKLASKLGRSADAAMHDLCQDVAIKEAILVQLHEHGIQHKLSKFELPYRIHLSPEPWTPQTGLVTAALKNQRTNLAKRFANEIKFMYA